MSDNKKSSDEHCDLSWWKNLGPIPIPRSSAEEYELTEWLMLKAMDDAIRKGKEREERAARAAAKAQKAKKATKPKEPPLA